MTDLNTTIRFAQIICKYNRDSGDITSLAADIKAQGLLQPIRLVEKSKGMFEVVDGRRRFAALKAIGETSLRPGMWVMHDEAADEAALRIAAFSANTQRKPLTLFEEVQQLNDLHKSHTIPQLAAIFGKTESYIALRLNLAELSAKWMEVLKNHDEYPQWTAAKLQIIARETVEMQEDFANDYNISRCMTEKELRECFAEKHAGIASFPFDLADCNKCEKRSSQNGLLFAEICEAEGDQCLDRKCYGKKLEALIKKLRKENPKLTLVEEARSYDCGNEYIRKIGYEAPFREGRLPKEGEKPNAISVWGPHAGRLVVVKEPAKAVPVKKEAEEVDPAVELKRLEDARDQKVNQATVESFGKRLAECAEEAAKNYSPFKKNDMLRLLLFFSTTNAWEMKRKGFDEAMKKEFPYSETCVFLFNKIADLCRYQARCFGEDGQHILRRVGEIIGEDSLFTAARAEALSANPVDKKIEALRLKVKQNNTKKANKEDGK